jgi:hypothetical protein
LPDKEINGMRILHYGPVPHLDSVTEAAFEDDDGNLCWFRLIHAPGDANGASAQSHIAFASRKRAEDDALVVESNTVALGAVRSSRQVEWGPESLFSRVQGDPGGFDGLYRLWDNLLVEAVDASTGRVALATTFL